MEIIVALKEFFFLFLGGQLLNRSTTRWIKESAERHINRSIESSKVETSTHLIDKYDSYIKKKIRDVENILNAF